MTEEELEEAGFKRFQPNPRLDQWDVGFQRRVRDEYGTRYFVNVRMWDFRKYGAGHVGWDCELVSNDGAVWWGKPMWLKTSCHDKSPAEVLAWAAEMWDRLALNYYERKE